MQMPNTDRGTAVYPGTFDPLTNGHIDIIERALVIFPKLIVAVAKNIRKGPLFDLHERMEMIRTVTAGYPSVSVKSFDGLLTDYLREQGARTIIRGLRAISDFEYEFQMAMINRKLNDHVDTIFLMPSEEHFFLTSTLIKEVAGYGGDVSHFVPKSVCERLQEHFGPITAKQTSLT
jgi:pantetheine-phosphate adenylyltransferase